MEFPTATRDNHVDREASGIAYHTDKYSKP